MSVSKYRWTEACEGQPCPGDCDLCFKEPEAKNDDSFSRKAVLNWLTNEWDGMVTSLFDGIKNLPAAQPEIIRCEDCKHYREYISRTNEIAMMCFCPCCIGGQGKKNPDDFCSRAERRNDDG